MQVCSSNHQNDPFSSIRGMLFVVCMLLYNNKLFKMMKTEPHMDKLCPLFWRSPSLIQLRELQDKYAECLEILHEAQEELKNFRNKSLPPSTTRRFHSLGLFPMVSSCSLSAATPAPCPASASIPLTFVPLCPGFSGRWDRGHHEEGITDGWSRRRRTKVFIFSPKKPTWLPTVLPKKVWGSCTENAGNDICICIFSIPSPGSNQSEFSRRWKTWTWCVSSVRRSLRPLSTSRDPIRRRASRRVAPAVRAHRAPTPFMGVRWEVASSWTTRPAVFWRVQMMGREADLAVYSIIVMPFLRACGQCLWFTKSLFLF